MLAKISKNNDIVFEDSFAERGCSAYALVKGSSWNQAQANAEKLGGNLTTPNSQDENRFLIDKYTRKLSVEDPNWGNGLRSGAWIGLSRDSEGKAKWSNGEELDNSYESPYGAGQAKPSAKYLSEGTRSGYHILMTDPSGHAQRHGGLNGWWQEPANGPEYYGLGSGDFWGYNWGIAEIPLCSQ